MIGRLAPAPKKVVAMPGGVASSVSPRPLAQVCDECHRARTHVRARAARRPIRDPSARRAVTIISCSLSPVSRQRNCGKERAGGDEPAHNVGDVH